MDSLDSAYSNMADIIYMNHQDVIDFAASTVDKLDAYAYEWEEEGVVHIHLHPLKHSFGNLSKVSFSKASSVSTYEGDSRFLVLVATNVNIASATLFERTSDGYSEKEFVYIPSQEDLYSRNEGLLELDILSKKKVIIVGLGSFGSQIAIELAKAGVGVFSLFDFDRVELHNLSRHTCNANELGRLKTDAIEDAILGKNPYATVKKYPVNINEHLDLLEKELENADLMICATDNNASRYNISKALVRHKKIGIFGRAITRAEGGDVFRYRPGGPCYGCLIGADFLPPEEITNVESARGDGRIPAYVSAEDANAIVQVGLSSDIQPICNLMVKISLLELSRGLNSGINSLEDDLVYDCYIWANRREKNYKEWHPFFQAGKNRTVMRWYGVNVPRNEGCAICSHNVELDVSGVGGFRPQVDDLGDVTLEL